MQRGTMPGELKLLLKGLSRLAGLSDKLQHVTTPKGGNCPASGQCPGHESAVGMQQTLHARATGRGTSDVFDARI